MDADWCEVSAMCAWHEDAGNADLVRRLRTAVADGGRVLVFLGAGVSFAGSRYSRATFDNDKSGPSLDRHNGRVHGDDGLPMPSWPWLIGRMRERLLQQCPEAEQEALSQFFQEEGALDCAQLFKQTVGLANYREFLLEQFDMSRQPFVRPSPSHAALVRLDLPVLFTTNYDELIETAYQEVGRALRVTVTEDQFRARRADRPRRHLVKLHGSIDQPETIVLTRTDYARSRVDRKEMLADLRNEMAGAPFLFVGFSLSDPNFGLLHDDIRLTYGMNIPASYTVQGRRNAVKERYLRSMDVNTVWLDTWNQLPDFLLRLDPNAEQKDR